MKREPDTIPSGRMSDQVAAVGRLFKGTMQARIATLAFDAAGAEGAAWTDGSAASLRARSTSSCGRLGSIGGGTVEMARNVISERVLAMPRERNVDGDVPFREVPRSRPTAT